MGNYFDTCLSFQGFNSFATVVNACDLNKRVVYARDKKGKVVGRKLIGINDRGELVIFKTYSSLDKTGYARLETLILDYLKDFASKLNLKTGTEGTVAALSSKHWYCDGTVEWSLTSEPELNQEEQEVRKTKHRTRH
jgi:hypothetical protein